MSGLSRFAIPLVAKVYPQLIASKLVSVQPMSAPAALIHYMRYRYGKTMAQAPAPPEVIGAIVIWFQETFPHLKIEQRDYPEHHVICNRQGCKLASTRVAVLDIWDGRIDFYYSKFEMSDPEMLDKLHAAVTDYFKPVGDNNEEDRSSLGGRLPI